MTSAALEGDEREAMDCLDRYMEIVWRRWELRANRHELSAAIHVLQGAVIQHMLHRIDPARWGTWFEAQQRDVEADDGFGADEADA